MTVSFLSPFHPRNDTRHLELPIHLFCASKHKATSIRCTIYLGFKSPSRRKRHAHAEPTPPSTARQKMAPLTPTWAQPSHPFIQEVRLPSDPSQFTTKSLSKVNLAPYAVFAKLAFPPCARAKKPTYATVQMGKDEHLNLNSDLVYINHSCDPSLVSLDLALLFCGGCGATMGGGRGG